MKTWRERIAEAREHGGFSAKDVLEAENWNRCAVGEQRKIYGKVIVEFGREFYDKGYYPKDSEFSDKGYMFYIAVRDNNFNEAERLLTAIEDRSLVLKRQKISK